MASANSILDSFLVPSFKSDILVLTDKNRTAGVFQSGSSSFVLTQGSLNVIYNSLVDAVEPMTVKSAFPRNAGEKDVASRWLGAQEGLNVQACKPELGGVSTSKIKAGEKIDAGNAGTLATTEDGVLMTRSVETVQGTAKITWFESDSSLIECGIPLIKDAMSVSNSQNGQMASILPQQKLSNAGSSCTACATCGVCTLCAEINVAAGAVAVAALTALDASAAAIRTSAIC